MRFSSKYFLFQVLGWGAYFLFNIYIAILLQEFNAKVLLINILLSLMGFLLSHVYRKTVLQRWLKLSTELVVRNVLLATAVMSVLFNIFYYVVLLLVLPDAFTNFTWETYGGSFIQVFVIFASWNAIYFSSIYIEKNKRIQIETLKMESALKDLEIKTIRQNLQPHFIFNALNSIRALIDEDPELARNAITRISNILRNSITKQDATDTLENELLFIDDYLAIEKIRFEERLHFVKDIAPDTLLRQVPTMMMQTLIENALKHGISNLEEGGEVMLRTYTSNDGTLHIEIENDIAPGIPVKNQNSLGFGINASRQRLNALYGTQATLNFQTLGTKALVHICIPQTEHLN